MLFAIALLTMRENHRGQQQKRDQVFHHFGINLAVMMGEAMERFVLRREHPIANGEFTAGNEVFSKQPTISLDVRAVAHSEHNIASQWDPHSRAS